MMLGAASMNEPGTYVVSDYDKATTVEVDSFEYVGDWGELHAIKDGQTIGIWRSWSSVVKK